MDEVCSECGGPLDKKGCCELCSGLDRLDEADHLGVSDDVMIGDDEGPISRKPNYDESI